jgi:hypothetical protein
MKSPAMTSRIDGSPLERSADDTRPTGPSETGWISSTRRAGIVAGAGILLIATLAAFGDLVVVEGLVTPGDAAKTAKDIMASQGMFRLGVAALYLVVVLDVIVAWALLRVFAPVNEGISRLAAWFRLAYAGVFLVALSQLVGIPQLLSSAGYSASFGAEGVQAQALLRTDAYHDIWMAGLVLFGIHLLAIGYLAYRSGSVPRILGMLLAVAGLGYLFDSFGAVLSEGAPTVSSVTFFGEFLLAIWLLIRSRHLPLAAEHGGGRA